MDKTLTLNEQCTLEFDKTKKLIERRKNSFESRTYTQNSLISTLFPNWDEYINNTKVKKFCSVNCKKNVYVLQSDAGNVVDHTENDKTKLYMLINGKIEVEYNDGETEMLDSFQTISISKNRPYKLNTLEDSFLIVVEI